MFEAIEAFEVIEEAEEEEQDPDPWVTIHQVRLLLSLIIPLGEAVNLDEWTAEVDPTLPEEAPEEVPKDKYLDELQDLWMAIPLKETCIPE